MRNTNPRPSVRPKPSTGPKIEPARPRTTDDYERRMSNWRRWRLGGAAALVKRNSPLAFTLLSSDLYNRTEPRHRDATLPLLVGEAEDTQRAVQALEPAFRRVVEVWYLERGGVAHKARLVGCRKQAMIERVTMARQRLLAILDDQRMHQRNRALVHNSTSGPTTRRIALPSVRSTG